jgi:hypothetical protein
LIPYVLPLSISNELLVRKSFWNNYDNNASKPRERQCNISKIKYNLPIKKI